MPSRHVSFVPPGFWTPTEFDREATSILNQRCRLDPRIKGMLVGDCTDHCAGSTLVIDMLINIETNRAWHGDWAAAAHLRDLLRTPGTALVFFSSCGRQYCKATQELIQRDYSQDGEVELLFPRLRAYEGDNFVPQDLIENLAEAGLLTIEEEARRVA